jgi:hypothetical protein
VSAPGLSLPPQFSKAISERCCRPRYRAHGSTISLTGSASGGAQFTVEDVTFVETPIEKQSFDLESGHREVLLCLEQFVVPVSDGDLADVRDLAHGCLCGLLVGQQRGGVDGSGREADG